MTRPTDHVIKSNQHDQQYYAWGDDDRRYQTWGDNNRKCQIWGNNNRRGFTIVWLGSLEFQFIIKRAVVHLNWGLSSMVAK